MEEQELIKLEQELKNKEKEINLRRKEKEITSRLNSLEEKPAFNFEKYKGWIIGGVIGLTLLIIAIRIIGRFI